MKKDLEYIPVRSGNIKGVQKKVNELLEKSDPPRKCYEIHGDLRYVPPAPIPGNLMGALESSYFYQVVKLVNRET